MGRDHSIECPDCGVSYGGMNAESEEHECAAERECNALPTWLDFRGAWIHFECPRIDVCGDHCHVCNGMGTVPFSLRTLLANLAIAGALCASYDLGYFEQGSPRPRWWPGCGHPPITRDARARDDHFFEGDECDCTLCGEGYRHYLHKPDHDRDEEAEHRGAP